jgi:dipeptidyl aminopeptidase/acylaminoacyl peptidase
VYTTDLEGNVTEVDFGLERPWSAEILDVYQSSVLLKCSSFKVFPKVFSMDYTNSSELHLLDPHSLPEPLSATQHQALSALQSIQITPIQHKNSPCQSTLYWTTKTGPLAVMIHGGPHGNGTADYTVEGTMLATLGFNLLVVNYRGSTGLGQDALEALVGNVGRMDIDDVIDAINTAQEVISIDKIVSIGGSHGGFLSSHMAATGLVKAAVVKNGVTNIASMNLATDITDWPSAESLQTLTPHPPTSDDIRRMYEASPLSHAGNVSVPVLIIAGGSDKRVPSSQSQELYRVLKARGQDVKMLWYPKDGHALQTPATGYDFMLNELIWLVAKLGLS